MSETIQTHSSLELSGEETAVLIEGVWYRGSCSTEDPDFFETVTVTRLDTMADVTFSLSDAQMRECDLAIENEVLEAA